LDNLEPVFILGLFSHHFLNCVTDFVFWQLQNNETYFTLAHRFPVIANNIYARVDKGREVFFF
jgi:hypothetical protein